MLNLKDDCNKEIFLAYNEENNEGNIAEIYVTKNLMDMVEYLKRLTTNLDCDIKILHGILTEACGIPKNLRGKSAFIIVEDLYNTDHAIIMDSEAHSDIELANSINAILKYGDHNTNLMTKPEIEDIYILYGYEISIILALDEEELDEEIIETCKKIAKDSITINSLNE